eukprot:scaffold100011_cov30-Tisochrysis_lutea.AAC.3
MNSTTQARQKKWPHPASTGSVASSKHNPHMTALPFMGAVFAEPASRPLASAASAAASDPRFEWRTRYGWSTAWRSRVSKSKMCA